MRQSQDVILRQWSMLRRIPRHPAKISAQDLQQELTEDGYDITERSVQRDLNALSHSFPLCCDEREKPYGWSWQKDAPSFDLPGLSIPEALSLVMTERFLQNLLPSPLSDHLAPYFKAARQRLDANRSAPAAMWQQKVGVVPPAQPLLPPIENAGVREVISEALFLGRQLSVKYQPKGENEIRDYRLHPLALIQRGPITYLSCRIFDFEDVRTLALHRISLAEKLDEPVQYPEDFSLQQQMDSGIWGFGNGETIQVSLKFCAEAGEHLLESKLSEDQQAEALPDNNLLIRASVPNTPQLVWWILGFAELVEVLEPLPLRERIAECSRRMAALYSQ